MEGCHGIVKIGFGNLCSGEDGDDDDGIMYAEGDDYDDEHMWDSDDEAKLANSANHAIIDTKSSSNPLEQAIYSSMASIHLPEQILTFLKQWIDFLHFKFRWRETPMI